MPAHTEATLPRHGNGWQNCETGSLMMSPVTAEITCPTCGHAETESIPNDRCLFLYECKGCGIILKPKPGDCCVFCSFADRPCLSAQRRDSSK
jgi:hypothetical protein